MAMGRTMGREGCGVGREVVEEGVYVRGVVVEGRGVRGLEMRSVSAWSLPRLNCFRV
jgi:hypothetical protein